MCPSPEQLAQQLVKEKPDRPRSFLPACLWVKTMATFKPRVTGSSKKEKKQKGQGVRAQEPGRVRRQLVVASVAQPLVGSPCS